MERSLHHLTSKDCPPTLHLKDFQQTIIFSRVYLFQCQNVSSKLSTTRSAISLYPGQQNVDETKDNHMPCSLFFPRPWYSLGRNSTLVSPVA